MATLSKRKKAILAALKELGGIASVKLIAEKAQLNTNGVSQTLGFMGGHVEAVRNGKMGSKLEYKLLEQGELVLLKKGKKKGLDSSTFTACGG